MITKGLSTTALAREQIDWCFFSLSRKNNSCDNLSLCIDTNYLKLFNDYDPAKVEMYMTLCQAKDLKFGVILDL